MLAKERQNKIIEILYQNKLVNISDLERMFEISKETARRDLDALEKQHIAKRIYGGAELIAPVDKNDYVAKRLSKVIKSGQRERAAIGRMAASFINEGDSIMLEVGNTVHEVAKNMSGRKNLSVVTNSIQVLNELTGAGLNLFMLGGHVDANEHSLSGKMTEQALHNFFFDKAFVGAGGVTFRGGISDFSIDEAMIKSEICKLATKVYLVAHSAKFGTNSLSAACPLQSVHTVITDTGLSPEYKDGIREMGIELILVDPE